MKKINWFSLLMVLVMTVSVVACGDDDKGTDGKSDSEIEKSIVGKWSVIKYESWYYYEDEKIEEVITYDENESIIHFKADNTFIWDDEDDDYIIRGTWEVKDKELVMIEIEDGNKTTETAEILELTSSKLVYKPINDGIATEKYTLKKM